MGRPLGRIVLGMGETDGVDPNLEPAIRLAEANDATLYLVNAYWLPDPLLYPYPEMSVFDPEAASAAHEAILARMDAQVRTISTSVRVELRAVPVPADLAIIEVSEEVAADLIIVGATRRGTLARAVIGATAQRVVRTAKVPVLVVRRQGQGAVRRVLMTTDLSNLSAAVYERALDLVELLGRGEDPELRTLLAVGHDLASPPSAQQAVLERILDLELAPFLARLPRAGENPDGKVRLGDAAHEIVAEAGEWGADLLVLGTHGRGGISRFLIGSVAESALRKAPCDVLIIPAAALTAATSAPKPGTAR